jgi:hypothetical protein
MAAAATTALGTARLLPPQIGQADPDDARDGRARAAAV